MRENYLELVSQQMIHPLFVGDELCHVSGTLFDIELLLVLFAEMPVGDIFPFKLPLESLRIVLGRDLVII